MDEILKDLEEAQDSLKKLLMSPFISVSQTNRDLARKLEESLNRTQTRIQDYNELTSIDSMIDDIAGNLKKE